MDALMLKYKINLSFIADGVFTAATSYHKINSFQCPLPKAFTMHVIEFNYQMYKRGISLKR